MEQQKNVEQAAVAKSQTIMYREKEEKKEQFFL